MFILNIAHYSVIFAAKEVNCAGNSNDGRS